jgi:MoaA/NifB/PqqE/SkfB family radical SAM enzyme
MGLLYTPFKIFHYREKIESLPPSNDTVLPPVHIRIKPTNRCNHNCRYCAYRTDNLQLGSDMSVSDSIPREKMNEIADDIVAMGVKAVTFSGGGEPLLYPWLPEILHKFIKGGVRFATLTNGANLKGDIARLFAESGTWVRVSIDGWDDESYSEYRGVKKGEFSRVIGNMKDFSAMNGPCILGASIIADRKNAPHIYELIGTLREAGVSSVKVAPCIVSNSGDENNLYHEECFDRVKDEIGRAIHDFCGEKFEIFDSYHALSDKFEKAYTWCPYLQILTVIGADSNVYSCQDKAYNTASGIICSLKEKRFREAWFSGKKQYLSIDPSKHCNHHCVSNAKNRMVLEYLEADPDHLMFV